MAGVDITEDLRIYPILAELNACLCAALGDGSPCFCGILVGPDTPVEYVGECEEGDGEASCGAAYVSLTGAYQTERFPEPLQSPTCNAVMAYNISVGVLRCTPIGEEDGGPISPEELERITLRALSDMKAIRQAIQCCFMRSFRNVKVVMGVFTPIPSEGGVVGGEWPIIVREDIEV
ncbi:hypothetical protein SEA_NAMAGO_32 [Microbacterium phage Namago]|nr:hypothetical protein SEA_NIKE_32 [Microbacterium phage Nike]QQO39433.1 hypothetical protein SEA_NAMAGO_32 [Microbacterium phage Namago]UVG34290.1 hypothetical protein SEA_GRASSBOY_33 [Microbacterium phage Grassboy]